jgi:hypothetical protein
MKCASCNGEGSIYYCWKCNNTGIKPTELDLTAIEERVKYHEFEVPDMWNTDEVLGYITALIAEVRRLKNQSLINI